MKTANKHFGTMLVDAPKASAKRLSHKRARGKLLLGAGLLGLASAACIIAAPELGLVAAMGGTLIAGAGSAGMTILARR